MASGVMSPIEAAARALCMADYAAQWQRLGKDGPALIEANWPFYITRVIAVLDAIRKPNEAMIDAGVAAAHGKNWGIIVENTYTEMIGKVLEDAK